MASNTAEETSSDTSTVRRPEMSIDEYAELVGKWQQAYYTWQTSSVTYYQ